VAARAISIRNSHVKPRGRARLVQTHALTVASESASGSGGKQSVRFHVDPLRSDQRHRGKATVPQRDPSPTARRRRQDRQERSDDHGRRGRRRHHWNLHGEGSASWRFAEGASGRRAAAPPCCRAKICHSANDQTPEFQLTAPRQRRRRAPLRPGTLGSRHAAAGIAGVLLILGILGVLFRGHAGHHDPAGRRGRPLRVDGATERPVGVETSARTVAAGAPGRDASAPRASVSGGSATGIFHRCRQVRHRSATNP
jgi:hypothetical protein